MYVYRPIQTGPFSSSVRTKNRLLLFGLLRWYEEISAIVIFLLMWLIVLPILVHYPLFVLWPLAYAAYAFVKLATHSSAQFHKIIADITGKLPYIFAMKLQIWRTAVVSAISSAYVHADKDQEWEKTRLPLRFLAFLLTFVAAIFIVSVRIAYLASGFQMIEEGATWLMFGPPIWLMARSNGTSKQILLIGGLACVANAITYILVNSHLSLDTLRLITTQSLWLILVCLLPVILSRYISDREADLNTVIKVLEQIARIRTPSNSEFANEAASVIAREFIFPEVHILLSTLQKDYVGEGLSLIGSASKDGRQLARKGFFIHRKIGNQSGITTWAAINREYCLVNDVSKDPEKRYLHHEDFPRIQSELAIPMLLGNELIGVLDVQSETKYAFSKDDVGLLQAIATHLAVALDDAQNLARVKGLYTISQSIAKRLLSQQERYAILTSIVSVAREVLLADFVILYPYNPAKGVIEDPVVAGEPRTYTSSADRIHQNNDSAVLQAIELGEPQFNISLPFDRELSNVDSETPLRSDFAKREDIQSTAILPLRLGLRNSLSSVTDTLGVMFVSYRNPRSFTAEYKEWCATLADLAALALQNALLNDRLIKEERANLRSEIHDGLTQDAASTRIVLERIVETFEKTGRVNKNQLLTALRCSQSLNRQVNYLVEAWRDPTSQFGLFAEIQGFITIIQETLEVVSTCSCTGSDSKVSPTIQHEVHMTAKEAVRNAVRHGRATKIHIELYVDTVCLKLTVIDNGRGFEPQKVLEAHGLRNILYRIERIGGTVRIESAFGSGTKVFAIVPLSAN